MGAVRSDAARRGRRRQRATAASETARHDRERWTVDEFARSFALSPETVRKAIERCGVRPARANGAALVYRVPELVDAIFVRDAAGNVDPARLDPYRRESFFKAELHRLTLAQRAGHVIQVEDYRSEVARVLKLVARTFDVAIDIAERVGGPEVAAALETEFDKLRGDLADGIVDGDDLKPMRAAKKDEEAK
jgi:hypothetical protein